MAHRRSRYFVVEVFASQGDLDSNKSGQLIMVSRSSLTILQTIGPNSIWSYQELSETTGMPESSLYVFCARLEKVGLLIRKFVSKGDPKRDRTEISLSPDCFLKYREYPKIVR